METLIIILAGSYLISKALEKSRDEDYQRFREEWRLTQCSKEQHFVGASIYHGTVYCEICKKVPKKIKWNKGQIDGWSW